MWALRCDEAGAAELGEAGRGDEYSGIWYHCARFCVFAYVLLCTHELLILRAGR